MVYCYQLPDSSLSFVYLITDITADFFWATPIDSEEEPPEIGVPVFSPALTKSDRKNMAIYMDTSHIYSFSIHTANIDVATWRIINVPGRQPSTTTPLLVYRISAQLRLL